MEVYRYKITYLPHVMCTAFVRISDEAVLYCSSDEALVRAFAAGFKCGSDGAKCYYIE